MTRRADRRPGRVLSLNTYIHRATLGLPKADRLDAAAELRAHLLERVAELEGQGYPRDEAEYLAVRAMGDPGVTNRQMLGHFFTTPLGWACVGLCLAGFVGWQIASQPKTKVVFQGLTESALLAGGTLPTYYERLDFDVPEGTRFLKIVYLGPNRTQESDLPITGRHIGGYVSVPAWRPWWKTRSPLPYADLPWSKTCHDEKPFHLFLAQTDGKIRMGTMAQNSNLMGLLWCSGIPADTPIGMWIGSPIPFSESGNTLGVSVNHLELDHWTPLSGSAFLKSGELVAGGALLVLPTAKSVETVPKPNYKVIVDTKFNEMKIVQP